MIDYDAVLFSKNKEKKDKKTISYFSQKNNKTFQHYVPITGVIFGKDRYLGKSCD